MFNKPLINFRPFFFLAVSISLGIGAGFLFYYEKILWGILVTVIFLLFTAFIILFSTGNLKPKLYFGIAFILIFSFGLGSFYLQVSRYDSADLEGHYYAVMGKVTNSVETEHGQRLTLENVSIEGDRTGKLKYGVNVLVYGDSLFEMGEIVYFKTELQDINSQYEGRFNATNIERGIKYTATVEHDEITAVDIDFSVYESVNIYIRNSIKAGMEENQAAVAIGMLLGSTEEIGENALTSYRSAGVAHIFAVSGLHVGFLATALNFLFNKIRLNKLAKAVIITMVLFFYSGVCGFSASSVRASVMCAVLLFSSVKGSCYDGLSSVGLAGTLLLFNSPIHMFCVGFQLSFVVVIGIILLSPAISRLLSFIPKKLADSLGTVVSAQLVGIPICLYAFKNFSTIAIIANLIFVPIVGVIFIFLFVAAIIGGLGISNVTLFVPNFILKIINILITALDYDVFIISGISIGIFAIAYYFAIVLPCGLFNFKKITKLITSLSCAVILILGTTLFSLRENDMARAYVIGDDKVCATVIKNEGENIMIVSDASKVFSLYKFKRLSQRENVTDLDYLLFTQSVKDIQPVITKLNQVFKLNKVRYYGLTDVATETVIRKAFNIDVRAINSQEKISEITDCNYDLKGYAVTCSVNGYDLVALSKFGSNYAGYKGLTGEYDYLIATDYLDFIYHEYKAQQFISYLSSEKYKNAVEYGTISLELK